jgi:hypothetical protein
VSPSFIISFGAMLGLGVWDIAYTIHLQKIRHEQSTAHISWIVFLLAAASALLVQRVPAVATFSAVFLILGLVLWPSIGLLRLRAYRTVTLTLAARVLIFLGMRHWYT